MGTRKKPRLPCPACGTVVENLRSKYCSLRCQMEFQYRDYIQRWLNGEAKGRRGEGVVSNHIRRWLIERAGGKCEKCGWCQIHPTTGVVPLAVNHIDGNSENHHPDNL